MRTQYAVSEGQKFAADTTLTVVSCASCHMLYAIPESLKKAALTYPGESLNGWKLSCPLGHTWWYVGRSVEKKLEDARDALARERSRHDQTTASLRATKAAATRARRERDRLKVRAAAGVCPCCNRTFKQLTRHMESKHPDFAAEKETGS